MEADRLGKVRCTVNESSSKRVKERKREREGVREAERERDEDIIYVYDLLKMVEWHRFRIN